MSTATPHEQAHEPRPGAEFAPEPPTWTVAGLFSIPVPRPVHDPGPIDAPTEQGQTSPPRLLLRVEEAAERLAISRTRMFAYLKSGAIESVKVGRLRRIPADALAAFVDRITAEQTTTAA